MPIDTRDKRDSAIHVGLPWRMRLPVPDGSIAAADRMHVALLYRGFAAAAETPLTKYCICAVGVRSAGVVAAGVREVGVIVVGVRRAGVVAAGEGCDC